MSKLQQVRIRMIISIAMLLFILYIVFSLNKKNSEASMSSASSARVMLKIEEVTSRINELESIQRGYIITHNYRFIEPFGHNEATLLSEVLCLKRMVAGNPVQVENVDDLEQLLMERLVLLKQHIVSCTISPSRFMLENMSMTRIMLKAQVIRNVEKVLMNKRTTESLAWSDRSIFTVTVSIAVAGVLMILAYMIMLNEYKAKVNIEKQLLLFQQQLKEKIEKLDTSNKELEQFAYVASHDLQEPLRKIITFNDRISQKFAGMVDPDMKDYLDRISNAASRMRGLIDDLLAYSRISQNDTEKTMVSLEQVVSIIKDNYEIAIQHKSVQFVHVDQLPLVFGDKTQMIQLFQNLVSNAIKFTLPGISPVITFSCTRVPGIELVNELTPPLHDLYYKITVKDNGIGFGKEDSDRIFVLFQRLHGRSEFEGTGIGLSICKKIAAQHEGYIRAIGDAGKGAEFFVFLPVPSAKKLT